jgi:hypothetical protein
LPDYVNITGGDIEIPGDGEHEPVTIGPREMVTADTNPAAALFADPADPDAAKPYEPVDEPPPEEPAAAAAAEEEGVTGADS